MGAAIGQSLPIAVGVLITPTAIIAVVLMLVGRHGGTNGLAFLLGWVVGIALVGTLVVLLVGGAHNSADAEPPTWTSILKLVLGLGLLALAVKEWRARPAPGSTPPAPKWMAAIDSFTAVKAFALAFLLGAINPKNLLLVVSGAATIAQATASTSEQLGALVVFVVVASIGVATPLVVYLVLGSRAASVLEGLKSWMTQNNATIMAVLLLVLGSKMIGDAITALS
ncbi:Sap, sulfolipid-1-addressing protein [Sanguibacter gelidistatuariae]|uniref:Sap, sulfolipid-1-addressing protein n=1 Tax=Sanguibacter gelidistatuariae TaxID=1814289 RepID=A0A1G6JZ18_9MICO|nr:GAP family protein [Sanguibacter gelidistatuariae]SDC23957.1 Sap, sulfolipid-1-addressing protein [Sanguibacter gelidistatuariae]